MEKNKDLISTYGLVSDLIIIILGFFEIDRFKHDKFSLYQRIIKNIAGIQIEFA